jgi:hypothetical protein
MEFFTEETLGAKTKGDATGRPHIGMCVRHAMREIETESDCVSLPGLVYISVINSFRNIG